MKFLSIDIGFKNPSFTIIDYKKKENFILQIFIYENIKFQKISDISTYLDFFLSKNIKEVIIEKQYKGKNINLMYYIYGYFNANNINVVIKNPISYLLKKQNIEEENSRKIKKNFSVDLLNNILEKNQIDHTFKYKNNDICDSVNICLHYLFYKNKNNKKLNFLNDFNINILNISFISIENSIINT